LVFRRSIPASFKGPATDWWFTLPKLVAMPKLCAPGSFFSRSTRSRPVLIGESAFTPITMYSPKRWASGVNSP
jgi:hypothetical protein